MEYAPLLFIYLFFASIQIFVSEEELPHSFTISICCGNCMVAVPKLAFFFFHFLMWKGCSSPTRKDCLKGIPICRMSDFFFPFTSFPLTGMIAPPPLLGEPQFFFDFAELHILYKSLKRGSIYTI